MRKDRRVSFGAAEDYLSEQEQSKSGISIVDIEKQQPFSFAPKESISPWTLKIRDPQMQQEFEIHIRCQAK